MHDPTPSGVRLLRGVPVIDDDAVRGVLRPTATTTALHRRGAGDPGERSPGAAGHQQRARSPARAHRERHDRALRGLASRRAPDRGPGLAVLTAAAAAIVAHDLLVFTVYDPHSGKHRVRHGRGDGLQPGSPRRSSRTTAARRGGGARLVALPYRGQLDLKTQFVFAKGLALKSVASVPVLPLVARDKALGTSPSARSARALPGRDPPASSVLRLRTPR
ncbi:MAG: hypothetical protein IPN17_16765 [Deltaproteobacteria bacterium]|nr:hypothetical protein [Deltaproteobacteria bacterium]